MRERRKFFFWGEELGFVFMKILGNGSGDFVCIVSNIFLFKVRGIFGNCRFVCRFFKLKF